MKLGTVLITGAGGFIGSHLVEACVKQGFKVKAFIRYNSTNSWGFLETSDFKNEIEVIAGDIRDFDSVSSAMQGCDTVFHLAALIGIPYSYISPLAYIKTNVEGTYNVLQAAKDKKVKNIIITSTSEVYGTAQFVPITENHPLNGQSPYSASKIAADQLALSYYTSFDLPVKIARPFNTYGPRQSARALIPTVITQILAGSQINIGNTRTTRDFNYVADTVNGFIAIACADKLFGHVVNIGSGKEIKVSHLIKTVAKLMDRKIKVTIDSKRIRPNKSEVTRLLCDNSKIKKTTGWKPEISFDEGLNQTISWYKENLNSFKYSIYNI